MCVCDYRDHFVINGDSEFGSLTLVHVDDSWVVMYHLLSFLVYFHLPSSPINDSECMLCFTP